MAGQVTGKTQRPEICDMTGWPALSSSSTPAQRKTWTTVKGRTKGTPPQQSSVLLKNRFSPLLHNTGSLSDGPDNLSPPQSRRPESKSRENPAIQSNRGRTDSRLNKQWCPAETKAAPSTLIVGDSTTRHVSGKAMVTLHS